jgi:drug/metabolite transporter (DMT)-like permease
MTFALGVTAALGAPLIMTIGFILWDNHWKGSAFSLNLYKCCTASIGFLILSLSVRAGKDDDQMFPPDIFTREAVGYLLLSSTIGIVIGDLMWLEGLRLLGAPRTIMMDSLKPFLAALFGWLLLDEELRIAAVGGIALTVAGVLLVALEASSTPTEEDNDEEKLAEDECISDENMTTTPDATGTTNDSGGEAPSEIVDEDIDVQMEMDESLVEAPAETSAPPPPPSDPLKKHRTVREMRLGYVLSLLNVVFDTYGAVLTKQYGEDMTGWEINLIRFGFAGLVMLVLSLSSVVYVYVRARILILRQPGVEPADQPIAIGSIVDNSGDDDDDDATEKEGGEVQQPTAWYALPMNEMTRSSWAHVSGGVLLVTFLMPTLSNYALFEIAIALALTLASVGPLYSLPLAYFLQNEVPTVRAYAGAVFAVAGIVVLAFWGTLPEEEANV